MTQLVTMGVWTVKDGQTDAFVQAWTEFAQWASNHDGAATMRLTRDRDDPARFVSFAPWRDSAAAHAWKAEPEFRERIGRIIAHTDKFEPTELDLAVAIADGSVGEV